MSHPPQDLVNPASRTRHPSEAPLRPPYDAELAPVLEEYLQNSPDLARDGLDAMRRHHTRVSGEELTAGRALVHSELTISAGEDRGEITLSIFRRSDHSKQQPCLYHIHGGGMVMGDRFSGIHGFLDWVEEYDVVLVSVEYRLAPEHPDPIPVEDCYAGLLWTAAHIEEWGGDPDRLLVIGGSAGGGLAAGTVLLSRDRGTPTLAGQMLMRPMLDDRNHSPSSRQFDGVGVWDRRSNEAGWTALLGVRRGGDDVSPYAAPARAEDLGNLPPTFIDVGSAEVFRHEAVTYAEAIWAAGGRAELHVWPGGFHGFTLAGFASALSTDAREAQLRWVRRLFGLPASV